MRNKGLILIAITLAILSCSNPETEKKRNNEISTFEAEYFEGVIEYSIDYKLINPAISKEILEEYLGTKIISSYSKGSWREDYYNNHGNWVRTSILNQKEKRYYYEILGNDTVYYSDINKTNYKTSIEQLSDTTISDHPCWTVKSTSIHKDNESDIVSSIYFISKQYKVDPEWYVNYIDGGYDRIYKIAPGLEYATEYSNSDFTQVRKFVSKRKKEISHSEFEIEPTKHVKKTRLT